MIKISFIIKKGCEIKLMIEKKTWKEFQETKLLWWINRSLHLFGWAIVVEKEGDKITDVYPAKVDFQGFDEKDEQEGFEGLKKYLKDMQI